MTIAVSPRRKPRRLALGIVASVGDAIRDGSLHPGEKLPTEQALTESFGVSRTVVREALSKLQAEGLVETRHGVGTFVLGASPDPGFRLGGGPLDTLEDVVAVLELRTGIETEAAALAARRRTDANLQAMREALARIGRGLAEGRDEVSADFEFHLEIARASRNPHFVALMSMLGGRLIPRARLASAERLSADWPEYLRRVGAEHESIYEAIAAEDPEAARAAMRTHLANGRERRRRTPTGPA